MRAEFARQFGNQRRPLDRSGVHGDFVRAGTYHGTAIFQRSNAPAGGERDCQFSGDAANCFEKSRAAIARRRDVEYDQFVCTFRIVSAGERNGVAGISQTHKIHPFHDAFAVRI